ncbi:hypothetical protein LTR95_014117 [Oleoguttula sp. CCFEE 5521]
MEAIYASQPLDAERKQLRLVTINAASGHDQLSYELSTYFLLDTTQAYHDFVPQRSRFSRPLTPYAHEWPDARIGDLNPCDNRPRFRWGDYAALSYVWGDARDIVPILVNGLETRVRSNLAEALYAVRDSDWFGEHLRLWVDALCINQQDDRERGQQVSLTRMLYAEAWSVIGFLGPEKNDSDLAVSLLESLAELSQSVQACEELRDHMVDYEFPPPNGSWLALSHLLNRPYWSRLWIMQELALGGARAILAFGSRRIEWLTFCRALSVIHEYLYEARWGAFAQDCATTGLMFDHEVANEDGGVDHVWKDLGSLTLAQESPTGYLGLGYLIAIASEAACSDDRDRVYGVLGLVEPRIAQKVVPDYSKDVASVFTETAEAYIAIHHDLHILRDANLIDTAGCPSWVPDWLYSGRCRYHRPDGYVYAGMGRARFEQRRHAADGGLSFPIPRRNGSQLACRAVLLGRIDGLGYNPEAPSVGHNAEQLAIALYAGRRRYERDSQSILHLPLTLADAKVQFNKTGWKVFAQDMGCYERWLAWFDSNADLQVGGRRLREYFSGQVTDESEVDDYYYAFRAWVRTALAGKRRLVIASTGRTGWADCARSETSAELDSQARQGDVFAVFPGCITPILLRPMDVAGNFRVSGDAYLQGCMEGEVEGLDRSGQYHLQKACLH